MKKTFIVAVVVALVAIAASAFAYELKTKDGDSCSTDKPCLVYCKNGEKAGSMTWNGSVWSDGVRWDKDKDVVARAIVKANGSACE